MNDPLSAVSEIIHRDAVAVRRPEKETHPKLFYKGADQVTLDPLAARRPDGGLFMWSEQGDVPHQVPSGHADGWNSSAAAVLSYDVVHRAPWDWRVSLYTFTKSVAAGAYLMPLLLAGLGIVPWTSRLWGLDAAVIALAALVLTGLILVWDLEHPERFWMVLLRPQPRSWLVKGGFIITGYGALLAAHVGATVAGRADLTPLLAWAGGPLALGAAVYTAYLFAQARARDLWQSPLLPAHLAVQAFVAGGAVLSLAVRDPTLRTPVASFFGLALVLHLALAVGEATVGHPTADAALAARNMTRGRFAGFFWGGLSLSVLALVTAATLPAVAAVAGLVGLLLFEHAYVQAGQSVPLA
jgi:formate-dependent nitrite reductase membrane component NrfD